MEPQNLPSESQLTRLSYRYFPKSTIRVIQGRRRSLSLRRVAFATTFTDRLSTMITKRGK